jgi:hypothetical protein
VCSFAQCEEVKELSDIVSSDVGIMAFLPEARTDGCALFLYNGPLVGNSFSSTNIADELFDYLHSVVSGSRFRKGGGWSYGNSWSWRPQQLGSKMLTGSKCKRNDAWET